MAEAATEGLVGITPLELMETAPDALQMAAPSPPPVSTTEGLDDPQRFEFTGSGGEYFRIWVVNLLLTIATLGIYSAWAKVRRLQYFYRNTRVAGAIFDYHGAPKAILKGRVLALTLLAAYKISYDVSVLAAIIVALILIAIMPWLLARSFSFKMFNSTYRGMRFRFSGTVGQAYRMLSLLPILLALMGLFLWSIATSYSQNSGWAVVFVSAILLVLVGGATVPLAHYLLKRFQHDHANFGQSPFFFHAHPGGFFKIYGLATGFFFLGTVLAGLFHGLTNKLFHSMQSTMFGWLFTLLYSMLSAYVLYLFVRPFLESRVQNLVWNSTDLGSHKFESRVSTRHLLWIHASNLILITLTLGLYKPFAVVRLIRYRVESMSLLPSGSLEDFLTDQSADEMSAIGQEAGDLFDIEIAL